MSSQLFGKFRGTVLDNVDPLLMGRIQAVVPDVSGGASTGWALPCVPFAGPGSRLLALPPIGSSVWIEFERGDPDYPIWVGGFWNSAAEVDRDGEIRLEIAGGASITLSADGIVVANGKGAVIRLVGPTVDINNGALTVT